VFSPGVQKQRQWIIAYPDRLNAETWMGIFAANEKEICDRYSQSRFEPKWWMDAVYSHAGGNDGVSGRVGIKHLGNAIVPQCAELFFMLPCFDKWRSLNPPVFSIGRELNEGKKRRCLT
jgi:hypothetical protein